MAKIQDASDDLLIKKYIALRDARTERKRAYEADDEKDKVMMGKIENDMLRRLNERGTDSSTVRGVGVAFKKTRSYCSVADWDIFFKYVQDHQAWSMLTHAASKEAVAEFKEANNDLPPGLNWTETIAVNFNRG
jgi:hypothetical protein